MCLHPDNNFWYSGMWLIPVFMAVVMLAALYLMFGRGGCRGPCGRRDGSPRGGGSESALDLLEKRYAKGEISKEDFDRMKKDIRVE